MSNFRNLIAGALATAAYVCISSPSWAIVVVPTYNYTVQNGTYSQLEDPAYSGSLTVTGATVTAADIVLSDFGVPASLTFTDITFQGESSDNDFYTVGLSDTTSMYFLSLVLDNPIPPGPLFSGQTVTVDSASMVLADATGETVADDFTGSLTTTPLPAAFPLFAGGLGVMGLFGRRKKQKVAAVAA